MYRLNRMSGLVVLAFVVLGVTPVRSQESAEKEFKNSLVKGAWALQYQVKGDITLGSFAGNTLSIKKHTSDGKAWRLGLSLALSLNDHDGTRDNGDASAPTDGNDNNSDVILAIQRIIYPDTKSRIVFYYGVGLEGRYMHGKTEANTYSSETSGTTRTTTNDLWSGGVNGTLGAEWFVTRNISLLAEYGSSATYRSAKSTVEELTTYAGSTSRHYTESKSHGVSFKSIGVRFGLSAYF